MVTAKWKERTYENTATHADHHQTRRGEEERDRRHHRTVREEWLPHSGHKDARNLPAPGGTVLRRPCEPAVLPLADQLHVEWTDRGAGAGKGKRHRRSAQADGRHQPANAG